MWESILDNAGDDKANTVKQAIIRPDWLKWREAIQVEYDFLIENEIWELTATRENRQVIIGRCCFKLKIHRNDEIVK